jgi:hypothetical protein
MVWYRRYRRKTRSVQFGIKKGAIAPFFPQKGGNGPLFKELCPPFEEKRGERYKKGGNDTDQKYQYRANLIPGKYRYRKNDWNHRDTTLMMTAEMGLNSSGRRWRMSH